MTTKEEIDKDNQEFFKRQKLFEPLVASDGWKELEKILFAQHAGQVQKLLEPPASEQDGINSSQMDNYRKGVVFGIQLTLKTPYATIETAKEILRDLSNRQPKDELNGNRPISQFDDDANQLPDGVRVRDLGGDDE